MFEKVKYPQRFQGNLSADKYFEGWYFKKVNTRKKRVISLIPGISLNKEDPHAFIQVIFSHPMQTHYIRFDVSEFSFSDDPFEVRISKNRFSMSSVHIDVQTPDFSLSGNLIFSNLTPIFGNIMGPFAYLPSMQCSHGVLSMSHRVDGLLHTHDEVWEFESELGYIEKDWGTSFPKHYFWLQSNHFEDPSVSFMASFAHIPMGILDFEGLIALFRFEGKEYRFATYNGGKIKDIKKNPDGFSFLLTRKDVSIHVVAVMDDTVDLAAPVKGKMDHVIKEGLGGHVICTLKRKGLSNLTFTGTYAGIEWAEYLEKK